MKKRVLTCIGTRPNIMKITCLEDSFKQYSEIDHLVLHTGQHHDYKMSEVFFEQFGLKTPDFFLNISSGTQVEVMAEIMVKFEKVVQTDKPDLIMVPGDVNSSMACALVASRYNIPVAHIESGLRSFDRSMPEEQNRIIIDSVSSIYFVTEESGLENLVREGKDKEKIYFTGNTMIDTLMKYETQIDGSDILKKLQSRDYLLLTFHRPVNVDIQSNLTKVVSLLLKLSESVKVIFPVHPRTMKNLVSLNLLDDLKSNDNIVFSEPLGYFDFLKLVKNSLAVITDSGGVQEETTFLKVPCITVRTTTERPVTITKGTNTLVDLDVPKILTYVDEILSGRYKTGTIPEKWDGRASDRIAKAVYTFLYFKTPVLL